MRKPQFKSQACGPASLQAAFTAMKDQQYNVIKVMPRSPRWQRPIHSMRCAYQLRKFRQTTGFEAHPILKLGHAQGVRQFSAHEQGPAFVQLSAPPKHLAPQKIKLDYLQTLRKVMDSLSPGSKLIEQGQDWQTYSRYRGIDELTRAMQADQALLAQVQQLANTQGNTQNQITAALANVVEKFGINQSVQNSALLFNPCQQDLQLALAHLQKLG